MRLKTTLVATEKDKTIDCLGVSAGLESKVIKVVKSRFFYSLVMLF